MSTPITKPDFVFLNRNKIGYRIFSALLGLVVFHIIVLLPITSYSTYFGMPLGILISIMVIVWLSGFVFGWFFNISLGFKGYRRIFLPNGSVYAVNKRGFLYQRRISLGLSQEQIDSLYLSEIEQAIKDGHIPGVRPIQSE